MSINFWTANYSNIYTLNNHTQENASATGQVLVGGSATYHNYSVGQNLPLKTEDIYFALVVMNDMNITGGTNYSQNSGLNLGGTVTNYTMNNLNGVSGQPLPYTFGSAIFPYLNNYLQCSSIGWASLPSNGTSAVSGTVLTLTGTDSAFNTFLIDSTNVANSGQQISAIKTVNIIAPVSSTILINLQGKYITLNDFDTQYHGAPITPAQAQYVLWNLPEALTIQLDSNIYGALLAPFADMNTAAISIYGTLLTKNLMGSLNAINNFFSGSLPDLYNPSFTNTCTSFTTSTTTTTTTTTATTTDSSTTMSTTTCVPHPWNQAVNDLIESVALEQAALSHILNAEGEKIQKAVAMNFSIKDLLAINKSVKNTTNVITRLEIILQTKLKTVNRNLCN
ncbi:MAG: choice-of-anchor A family protein [Lachnospiraceae bacterium]